MEQTGLLISKSYCIDEFDARYAELEMRGPSLTSKRVYKAPTAGLLRLVRVRLSYHSINEKNSRNNQVGAAGLLHSAWVGN